MKNHQLKKIKLPNNPGVYFFKKGNDILYIGKATSLRDRVKSYFGKDIIETRGPHILDMVSLSTSIKWQETDSVLEALILEANLIKKYQPKYNTKEKDNKSFNYVCITKEKLPKILVIRGRNLGHFAEENFFSGPRMREDKEPDRSKNFFFSSVFGPFPNGQQLKEAMRIIRPIFPYMDNDSMKRNNREFYKQLGLAPIVGIASRKNPFRKVLGSPRQISLEARPDHFEKDFSAKLLEYKNNIKNIKLLFEGKKKSIVINLKREMMTHAKRKEFEKAGEAKKKIFALEHINDVALIKDDLFEPYYMSGENRRRGRAAASVSERRGISDLNQYNKAMSRLEAYDIAHMSGKNMVGVMTVIENGELSKSEYKKFIVRTQESSNDTGALEEVLSRRLRHSEWGLPNLIVVDGSTAQINVAKSVLSRYQFKIPVVSVVKDDKHKAKAIMGDETLIKKYKKQILLINSEAHRFAIAFHKKRRNKNFLN
jgi:excinuclease ABC subunit C